MFLPKVIRKERKNIPMFLKWLYLPSSCFALNIAQRSKASTWLIHWGYCKKLRELSAKDKQSYEQKAAKLKGKYEKDIAAYCAKGKSEVGKKGPGRPTGSTKKNEPEDEAEEKDEEEEKDGDEE